MTSDDNKPTGNNFLRNMIAGQIESVDYPIGHRRRRDEGIPELKKKFAHNLALKVAPKNADKIHAIVAEQGTAEATVVTDFTDLFVV